eukprot:gb/GFBE01013930.1/.p1 GENE.gb/GFBE01013930.1/~~gb/GFBE01013930.1/.p1  ORF type:complete len:396 (+),score=92.88 gb/GFBE01013930.1/:1-1188(+)
MAAGDENDGGEAAMHEMAKADADLDPVWGLLIGTVDDNSDSANEEPQIGTVENKSLTAADDGAVSVGTSQDTHADSLSPAAESVPDVDVVTSGASRSTASGRPISNVVDKAEVAADKFPLPPQTSCAPTVERKEIDGCDAFILDGVLTSEECDLLIAQAEGLWSFWETDPDRPRASFRNAHTVEVTHHELAERIWSRVQALVQPSVSILDDDDPRFEVDIEGSWVPYAMNPNMLLSRYLSGGHFSPHTDGTTVVDFNRRTFYSCVLFLNDSPWGGHTRLYADAQMQKELRKDEEGRLTGDPALVLSEVPPKPGRMLVFYHRLMHEGVPAAEKYIIRSDVLYRREPEICTAPEDVEAFKLYQEAQLRAEHGECDAAAALFRRAFKTSMALKEVYKM